MPGPERSENPTGYPFVYIGLKPTMTYAFQVASELHAVRGPVVVKARGNAIAKAVDVVEVVRRRLLPGQISVGPIAIDTERLTNRDRREANVSSIAITVDWTVAPPPPRPPADPPPGA